MQPTVFKHPRCRSRRYLLDQQTQIFSLVICRKWPSWVQNNKPERHFYVFVVSGLWRFQCFAFSRWTTKEHSYFLATSIFYFFFSKWIVRWEIQPGFVSEIHVFFQLDNLNPNRPSSPHSTHSHSFPQRWMCCI